jgi:hypothetical protein
MEHRHLGWRAMTDSESFEGSAASIIAQRCAWLKGFDDSRCRCALVPCATRGAPSGCVMAMITRGARCSAIRSKSR